MIVWQFDVELGAPRRVHEQHRRVVRRANNRWDAKPVVRVLRMVDRSELGQSERLQLDVTAEPAWQRIMELILHTHDRLAFDESSFMTGTNFVFESGDTT